jgi:hypothetical protein
MRISSLLTNSSLCGTSRSPTVPDQVNTANEEQPNSILICSEIGARFIARKKEFPTLMAYLRNYAQEWVRKLNP